MTEIVRASVSLVGLRGLIEFAHIPDLKMLTHQLHRAAELLLRVSDVKGDTK
jgi:hypothetical protein